VSENDGFAQEFYWRMREAVTGRLSRDAKRIIEKKKKGGTRPFDKGREPSSASSTLDALINDFKWTGEIGEAELFNSWSKIVGEDTAAKSTPETLIDGILTVRCSSTAWATQLRLMRETILEKLKADYPSLPVTEIKLLGPAGPSFKRGPRSVPGRGPRDTYG
jgi:predicted nucleic acid-binding Zn ribbon protein